MMASEKKAPADFRGRLRLATRDAHLRLEDAVDFDGRITSLEAYRGFIEDFYRLVRPLEAMLGGLDLSMLPIDYPSRRKLPWIEADLKDLGHTDETLARLPDYPRDSSARASARSSWRALRPRRVEPRPAGDVGHARRALWR